MDSVTKLQITTLRVDIPFSALRSKEETQLFTSDQNDKLGVTELWQTDGKEINLCSEPNEPLRACAREGES